MVSGIGKTLLEINVLALAEMLQVSEQIFDGGLKIRLNRPATMQPECSHGIVSILSIG